MNGNKDCEPQYMCIWMKYSDRDFTEGMEEIGKINVPSVQIGIPLHMPL